MALQRKVLEEMQFAERGLGGLHAALSKTEPADLEPGCPVTQVTISEHIDSLEMLKPTVLAVEGTASMRQ